MRRCNRRGERTDAAFNRVHRGGQRIGLRGSGVGEAKGRNEGEEKKENCKREERAPHTRFIVARGFRALGRERSA